MTEENKPAVAPQPTMENLPAEEADLQDRINGFNKELLPLLGKYELGLGATPVISPDGRVVATPIVLSVRGRTDMPQNQPENKPADAGLAKAE